MCVALAVNDPLMHILLMTTSETRSSRHILSARLAKDDLTQEDSVASGCFRCSGLVLYSGLADPIQSARMGEYEQTGVLADLTI
jgi:hypothetical protein